MYIDKGPGKATHTGLACLASPHLFVRISKCSLQFELRNHAHNIGVSHQYGIVKCCFFLQTRQKKT